MWFFVREYMLYNPTYELKGANIQAVGPRINKRMEAAVRFSCGHSEELGCRDLSRKPTHSSFPDSE